MKSSGKNSKRVSRELSELEGLLGHVFRDRKLLQQALTHSSHANEAATQGVELRNADNEQFEFLGDAVLGFVTSRALFERYPGHSEGQLSKTRAHLVSARHLVRVAKEIQLGDHLHLGKGEERSGGRSKSALLVDALEALLAAMYLDEGLEPARRFILARIVEPELARMDADPARALAMSDQKSALQEQIQATGAPQPSYHVVKEEGPDHDKRFTVEVRMQLQNRQGAESELTVQGEGVTKKAAEQQAARRALAKLQSAMPAKRE